MTKLFRVGSYTKDSIKEQDFLDKLNLPVELDDFKQVLIKAAKSSKYPPNDWLLPEGKKQDRINQYNSISHHINQILMGNFIDSDSGLDHRLHAACRLMMDYTRSKRGIVHPLNMSTWEAVDVTGDRELNDELTKTHHKEREFLIKSGTEHHNTKCYLGDKEKTKEEFDDIIATRHRTYTNSNQGDS